MTATLTLEDLVQAIRNGADIDELKRMIGPSEEEQAAAKSRIAALDQISKQCEWDQHCPSHKGSLARERWNDIMGQQVAFESIYY